MAASIISMIATPFLIGAAPRFGYFVQTMTRAEGVSEQDTDKEEGIHVTSSGGLTNHVIIVGYGLNGRNLARVLRTVLVPYTILELNAEIVRQAKEKGEKINYGDATRRELLLHAGIGEANALVLAMSDPGAARRTVQQARGINPDLFIIVRTRYITEITELLGLGADVVIPEEFETSIEIFARVLQRYGVARNVIEKQIVEIRRQGYEMLRSPSIPAETRLSDLNAALRSATTESVALKQNSPSAGKSLAELKVRGETGVTVIAVIRNNETINNPGAGFRIREEDHLILFGESKQIEKAIKMYFWNLL